MDIFKINNDTLKVMLTAEDLSRYSLDSDSFFSDTDDSVAALRTILGSISDDDGPVFSGYRLFVQIYTSPQGDCELFVRRLGCISMSVVDYKGETRSLIRSPALSERSRAVYSFGEMAPMLQTCRRLTVAGYSGESSAYTEDGKRLFYLILEERSPLPEEHGGKLCTKNTAFYIKEHCSLICADAVSKLGVLA